MQERSTERQWGRKCTQKSDRRMRYMQKNGNVKRSSTDPWETYGGNSEDTCSNTTEYRATLDQGGIEPPTDPDRPYCICLVGHWLGRREFFPKKYHFFGKIKNDFPKIVVKFRPPRRGLRKHRLSLYSRRLSLYSPIFPKK